MPMNPGNLTVTFNPPQLWVVDRLNKVPETTGLSPFTQSGCTMQAMSVKEKIDSSVFIQVNARMLTPASANMRSAAVDAEWTVTVDSNTYRVIEFQPIYDQWGRIDHCSFLLKNQEG